MKAVSRNPPASAIRTIPAVPVTVPVKYKPPRSKARTILIILSVVPIFFFIAQMWHIISNNELISGI